MEDSPSLTESSSSEDDSSSIEENHQTLSLVPNDQLLGHPFTIKTIEGIEDRDKNIRFINQNVKLQPFMSFQVPGCKVPIHQKNYLNIIQSCCYKFHLALGTENGEVYIYDTRRGRIVKEIFAEPWLSSIENCRGMVWTSGQSRSLMCIRIRDNKKLFHINTNA